MGGKIVTDDSFWSGGVEIIVKNKVPYVSVRTSSGRGKSAIYYYDQHESMWKLVGGAYASPETDDAQFQDTSVGDANIAVDDNGNIYTAYKCYSDGHRLVKVRMCNGVNGTWKTIFNAPDKAEAQQVRLQKAGSFIYLIVAGYDKGMDIYKLNTCGKWIYEGRTIHPDVYYNFTTAAGPNGEFYIGYDCTYNKKCITGVIKYTPYQFK